YVGFTVLSTAGFATFGVLSFHLATSRILGPPGIPVLYAAAMAVDAVAALVTGWAYDRVGTRVLFAVPVLSAFVPVLAFGGSLGAAVIGVLLWGAVLGVGESTMRAAVADLVPAARRGTAYGIFATGYGAAALVGGLLTGALHQHALPALITVVAVLQGLALLLLAVTRRQPVGRSRS
ncbi:MAG: MFS transporter, partial [Nonomuraea sp.]|nr:MFS transporter [Nonomuraea sp.]